jgi:hypothetical protein
MQKLFTEAETRSDNPGFTAEEAEKYDKMEAEYRSPPTVGARRGAVQPRAGAKKALDTPIELRHAEGDEVPRRCRSTRRRRSASGCRTRPSTGRRTGTT